MSALLSAPRVIVPLPIVDAMLATCSVAEPNTGETVWVSGGTYAAGDRRISVTAHREYECLAAHTGIATRPEDDPNRWQEIGPTDRWAMFDATCDTQTATTGALSVVLWPGNINAIALYKMTGTACEITVRDQPGGAVIYNQIHSLDGPYIDEYDWCWGPDRKRGKVLVTGLAPWPLAEVTLSVTAGAGMPVGIGMAVVGFERTLVTGDWGGTQYGARAEPVDYSYIKTDEFGSTRIVKRRATTDMRITAELPQADADYALNVLQDMLATPVGVIATSAPGYLGLNVFGLVSGAIVYAGPTHAQLEINVKGLT